MQKILFILIILCFYSYTSFSQVPKNNISTIPGQTSFYAELGGPGILFSANIDRRFKPSTIGFGFRAGIGFVTADEQKIVNGIYEYNPSSVITVPVQVNYIFGKHDSPHTFEAGAGITYAGRKLDIMNFYDERKSILFGSFSFMYRRQPINGGFSWRAGFTPLVANGYIQPSGAVSVGFNF